MTTISGPTETITIFDRAIMMQVRGTMSIGAWSKPYHVLTSAGLEICVTSELSLYSKLGKATTLKMTNR